VRYPMRGRLWRVIKRKLVLQPPGKNTERQTQERKGESAKTCRVFARNRHNSVFQGPRARLTEEICRICPAGTRAPPSHPLIA
jgi:hypothetical protein